MKNKISSKTIVRSIAIVGVLIIAALFISGSIAPALAISTGGVDKAMEYVIQIVQIAARYVGAVIGLWGIFQIILALRREDSEGVSKQIITVVVGAALVALSFGVSMIFKTLKNSH